MSLEDREKVSGLYTIRWFLINIGYQFNTLDFSEIESPLLITEWLNFEHHADKKVFELANLYGSFLTASPEHIDHDIGFYKFNDEYVEILRLMKL